MQKVEVCIFAKIDRPLRYITYAVFKCGIHSISQNQLIINGFYIFFNNFFRIVIMAIIM